LAAAELGRSIPKKHLKNFKYQITIIYIFYSVLHILFWFGLFIFKGYSGLRANRADLLEFRWFYSSLWCWVTAVPSAVEPNGILLKHHVITFFIPSP
jgi:hypothetical protein